MAYWRGSKSGFVYNTFILFFRNCLQSLKWKKWHHTGKDAFRAVASLQEYSWEFCCWLQKGRRNYFCLLNLNKNCLYCIQIFQSIKFSQYEMNLTGQTDTWRIYLVLEGIFIRVKLMELILLPLALDLTSVRFLLLELHFLGEWEHAETIGETGRIKGESILFCDVLSSVSRISRQHTGLHLVSYTFRAMQILLLLSLLWWSHSAFGTFISVMCCKEQTHFLSCKEELMSFPW